MWLLWLAEPVIDTFSSLLKGPMTTFGLLAVFVWFGCWVGDPLSVDLAEGLMTVAAMVLLGTFLYCLYRLACCNKLAWIGTPMALRANRSAIGVICILIASLTWYSSGVSQGLGNIKELCYAARPECRIIQDTTLTRVERDYASSLRAVVGLRDQSLRDRKAIMLCGVWSITPTSTVSTAGVYVPAPWR